MTDAELEAKYRGILLTAANSADKLRRIDVDRVMDEAFAFGVLPGFRAWILGKNLQPATRQAIQEWMAE